MSNKEGSKGDSAIDSIEAVRRLHMIFVSSIEAFDELFEGAPLGGLVIEVFETEDLVEGECGGEVIVFSLGVEEMNAGGIGTDALFGFGSTSDCWTISRLESTRCSFAAWAMRCTACTQAAEALFTPPSPCTVSSTMAAGLSMPLPLRNIVAKYSEVSTSSPK